MILDAQDKQDLIEVADARSPSNCDETIAKRAAE